MYRDLRLVISLFASLFSIASGIGGHAYSQSYYPIPAMQPDMKPRTDKNGSFIFSVYLAT